MVTCGEGEVRIRELGGVIYVCYAYACPIAFVANTETQGKEGFLVNADNDA